MGLPLLFIAWLTLAVFSGFQARSMVLFGGLTTLSSDKWIGLNKIFSFGPLRQLGKIAFGVYLLHMPIFGIMFGFLLNSRPVINGWIGLLVASASLGTIVGLARASFIYFEVPMQRIGHRWFRVRQTFRDASNLYQGTAPIVEASA